MVSISTSMSPQLGPDDDPRQRLRLGAVARQAHDTAATEDTEQRLSWKAGSVACVDASSVSSVAVRWAAFGMLTRAEQLGQIVRRQAASASACSPVRSAARPSTSAGGTPAARSSRIPVSPLDLLSFSPPGFRISG